MNKTTYSPPENRTLKECLRTYGCTETILLNEGLKGPEQLNYLDLLPKGKNGKAPSKVSAVSEFQGVNLLYVVDDSAANFTQSDLEITQRLLANRSDPAWLGVLKPGSLEVFPIGFASKANKLEQVEIIAETSPTAPLFFQNLAQGTFNKNKALQSSDFIFQKIYELLNSTSKAFVPQKTLKAIDVLSLAGRALFFRFLIDRKIVKPQELNEICPEACDLKDVFSSPEKATAFSIWLDETFNGDFLSIIDEAIPVKDRQRRSEAYLEFYLKIDAKTDGLVFKHLSAILLGWEVVGEGIQTELDWNDLDFAHIPVGVLSQVYESFSHLDDNEAAKQNSVHYTPRYIAELMVNQAFSSSKDPADAKILDPSCGAGIFLVLAFRRLFHDRWLKDEERPNYLVIQDLLYKQIRGFEVSESALRLAALSLYITAIELNASPRPPKSLRFPKNLRGTVLYDYGKSPDESRVQLGSLRDDVAEKWCNHFDIVIGNPPWTRLKEAVLQTTDSAIQKRRESKSVTRTELADQEFTRIGKEVLLEHGLEDLSKKYASPNKNPDLPFVWRATQWAKKDAIIAYALPARILIRMSGKGAVAWQAMTRCLSVKGVINGSNLRKTGVWRGVDFPWCILFAKNQLGNPSDNFFYSTPLHDHHLNPSARFRIDYDAATAVFVQETYQKPWILKALSIGTLRDVKLMETLLEAFPKSLGEIWKEWDPKGERTGQGYNRSPNLRQKPAEFLADLPDFDRPDSSMPLFQTTQTYFEKYGVRTAHGPRLLKQYEAPLLIIPQAPGGNARTIKAYLLQTPVAYSQSFYGYSLTGHPQSLNFAQLIYLIAHSSLLKYFCLMTSIRSGFDRQTLNKEDLDCIPFPDVSDLSKTQLKKIISLAALLEAGQNKPWEEIDQFIFNLYGLSETDIQTVKDTLFASAYYRKEGKEALNPPCSKIRLTFSENLDDFLSPFFSVCGKQLHVTEPSFQQNAFNSAWRFVQLSSDQDDSVSDLPRRLVENIIQKANETGSSRIILRLPEGKGLFLALLNQRRWWTTSRALMCGQYILKHHLDAFDLQTNGGIY